MNSSKASFSSLYDDCQALKSLVGQAVHSETSAVPLYSSPRRRLSRRPNTLSRRRWGTVETTAASPSEREKIAGLRPGAESHDL
jgi:hypothetical protein